nr:hypothetical protein [Mannheimia haemolytica]
MRITPRQVLLAPDYITVTGKAATAANTTNYEIGLTKKAIDDFTKDTQATVVSNDGTVTVKSTERNANGTVIYDLSVNIPAQASQIQYFSVNSTVPENQANDGAKSRNSIAIGPNATATGGEQAAVALGTNSNANGNGALSLGVVTVSKGIQATAVGHSANATANGTTALGRQTNATAGDATAVGSNANATSNLANSTANNFGGGSVVNPDGSVTQPKYNVTNAAGTQYGNTATNVGDAITNLNNYVNQGFNIKDNAGETKGTVTPNESV